MNDSSKSDFTTTNPPLIDVEDLTVCQPFNKMWLENVEIDRNEILTEELTYQPDFQSVLSNYKNLEIINETIKEHEGGDLGLKCTHPLNDVVTKKEEVKEEEIDDGYINRNLNKSILNPSMKRQIPPEKARKKEKEFLESQKERVNERIRMKEIRAKKIEDNQVKPLVKQ